MLSICPEREFVVGWEVAVDGNEIAGLKPYCGRVAKPRPVTLQYVSPFGWFLN